MSSSAHLSPQNHHIFRDDSALEIWSNSQFLALNCQNRGRLGGRGGGGVVGFWVSICVITQSLWCGVCCHSTRTQSRLALNSIRQRVVVGPWSDFWQNATDAEKRPEELQLTTESLRAWAPRRHWLGVILCAYLLVFSPGWLLGHLALLPFRLYRHTRII